MIDSPEAYYSLGFSSAFAWAGFCISGFGFVPIPNTSPAAPLRRFNASSLPAPSLTVLEYFILCSLLLRSGPPHS